MVGKLRFESLESRRLLYAAPNAIEPIDNSVGLVSFNLGGGRVLAPDFRSQIEMLDESEVSTVAAKRDQNDVFLSGDFDSDGVTDFLGADASGNWFLYLNDGSQLRQRSVGPGLSDVQILGAADFDRDGILDVVSIRPETGDLVVSLMRGDHFSHQVWSEFKNPHAWTHLYVGDFDGDTHPDVLGGRAGGQWWLARNYQGRTFQNHHWGRFADYDWLDVRAGDFNGDGIRDMVARAPDNTWWLWAGDASGFEIAQYFGHWKMRTEWKDVSVADFNGDGRDDVLGAKRGRSNLGRHVDRRRVSDVDLGRWMDRRSELVAGHDS